MVATIPAGVSSPAAMFIVVVVCAAPVPLVKVKLNAAPPLMDELVSAKPPVMLRCALANEVTLTVWLPAVALALAVVADADAALAELDALAALVLALLAELAAHAGLTLTAQVEGDLGMRLSDAIAQALQAHDAVLVIGSDCPGLTVQHLQAAADELERHDAVFHPALDGGYTLIGVRQNPAGLFQNMPWSTCEVMPETLRRMSALGWRIWSGEALADIDIAEDLVHLPGHWPRPAALAEQVT